MCGIVACITHAGSADPSDLIDALSAGCSFRGPDYQSSVTVTLPQASIYLYASVLHLRGPETTPQPCTVNQTYLLFNGEIYGGLDIHHSQSDTTALATALSQTRSDDEVVGVVGRLRGPFAFVWVDVGGGSVWYCRDCLGRRSLVECEGWLASVGREGWKDVEPGVVWKRDVKSRRTVGYRWGEHKALVKAFGQIAKERVGVHAQEYRALLHNAADKLIHRLRDAIRLRTVAPGGPVSRIAVMFSGGVDCTVLARLLDDVLPDGESVDLVNVAFENLRVAGEGKYDTPDRKTAFQSFKELKRATGRTYRLLLVDVPYAEAQEHRGDVLRLCYPNDTVMDVSIGLAFYFCARGIGRWWSPSEDGEGAKARTEAKVFFSGLGADEQLGGYSRHRAAAGRDDEPEKETEAGTRDHLHAELQLDLDRLPYRNLGRDDRIVSRWGRECRWPFLDEELVGWLCTLPVDIKCVLGQSAKSLQDVLGDDLPGDKIVLRLAAQKLGLPLAAREKKRAVQFGARSARMDEKTSRDKGHDRA
ncbi:hypothetical protein PYCC9005_003112 [Savitreella phatthalungensis]